MKPRMVIVTLEMKTDVKLKRLASKHLWHKIVNNIFVINQFPGKVCNVIQVEAQVIQPAKISHWRNVRIEGKGW